MKGRPKGSKSKRPSPLKGKTYEELYGDEEGLKRREVCKRTHKMPGKGFIMPDKAKERISEARSKYIEEKGQGGFLDVLYYEIQNLLGETYKVRGTWELKYAQYLNDHGVLWNRNISFKYTKGGEGIKRTYIPDFYLPDVNEYHEIKGYFSDKDKEKIQLVEEQNKVKIQVLQKLELENLGITLGP